MNQPKPIWQGNLSFGLVNVPVSLVSAVSRKELRFNFLHQKCGTPLQYEKHCPVCKREVEWDEVVRGFEYEKGKYAIITPEDFEKADVELTRRIDIVDFVDLAQINPAYFDRPFYLMPQKETAKTYQLLLQAMKETKKVGIAKVVIKTREYLAAIVPEKNVLLLEVMFFADEISAPESLGKIPSVQLEKKELDLAKQMISKLSEKFDIKKYTDTYREKLLKIIRAKVAGKKVVVPEPAIKEKEFEDLVAALKESMEKIDKEKV